LLQALGIFFKASDQAKTREWYAKHLGLVDRGQGVMLPWREHDDPQKEHVTVEHVPFSHRLFRAEKPVHDQLRCR
jgi:hypothetical protein